jgi:hypothetical protein
MKSIMRRFARIFAVLLGVAVCVGRGTLAQMPPQEQVTILELPPVSPHWIATASSAVR